MMLYKFVIGYPYPSMTEHLIVFALIFLAGSLWTICVRRYLQHRMKAETHA